MMMNQIPPSTSHQQQQTMYLSNSGLVDNPMMSTPSSPMAMNPAQSNLFNHQISAYKYLIRNQPVPDQHLMVIKRHQQQQFYPPNAVISKQTSGLSPMIDSRYKPPINGNIGPRYYPPVQVNGTTNYPSGTSTISENITNPNTSSSTRLNNLRVTSIAKPIGIDIQEVINERDVRIENNILRRINELEKILQSVTQENIRTRIMIELKALKLLNFQRQVRSEIVTCMRLDSSLETATNPRLYKRPKQFGLRDARATEKLEKQQKAEIDRKRRAIHQ
jgi:SWI/SNF-related matrix-associated actin-dependent regulator of chromatin subfamily A protein 2/4